MFFGPLILILIIIWFVFIFMRPSQGYYGHNGCHTNTQPPNIYSSDNRALDILRERYAKGEITEDEYLKTKRNLEQ